MPLTPEQAGAVWWAWLAAAMLCAAVYYDVRAGIKRLISARNVVLVGLFGWYLLEAIQAGPAVFAYGVDAYEYGVLLVLLAAAAFLLGYHRSTARWFDGWGRRVALLQDRSFRYQTLMTGVLLGSIPVVLYGLADPSETLRGLVAARHGWRGTLVRPALGDFRAAVVMLENFLLGVAWVAILILGDRRRTRGLTCLAAAVLAWHLVRAYGTGTRSVILLAAMIPAAWVYLRAGERWKRRLLLAVIPCAVGFYWFAGALVEGRQQGRLDFDKTPSYVGHEMFRELLFVVDEVPKRRPHLYGETLLVEALNPIPRFLWSDKPVGFGVVYARWHGEDALAGGPTLSPGILGEMYINFGWLGIVLLSILCGVACRAWDRLGPSVTRSMPVLLFHAMGLGCLLMQGRSFSLSVFYQMFAALICIGAVAYRARRRSAAPRSLSTSGVSRVLCE